MANTKEVEQEILDLEQGKVKALRASGEVAAKWFERHFADNIAYTTGTGGYSTKAQTVDEFRSGARRLHFVEHDDYHVRVYGNTAVLTYRGNDIMERDGKVGNKSLVRTTDVYVKQGDGVWRIVVHHVTPVRL